MLIILAAGFLFLFNPAVSKIFPPCIFQKLTGFYCSGCGTLRALHQLLHGNVAAAFGLNPLAVLCLPFLAYAFLAYFFINVFKSKIFPDVFIPPVLIWIFLALIVIYTILRNIPVYPFNILAPH